VPIEIKELVIRATVETGAGEKPSAKPGGPEQRKEIVTDCVEQVLEILRRERER
jgi:hypothetical protein